MSSPATVQLKEVLQTLRDQPPPYVTLLNRLHQLNLAHRIRIFHEEFLGPSGPWQIVSEVLVPSVGTFAGQATSATVKKATEAASQQLVESHHHKYVLLS